MEGQIASATADDIRDHVDTCESCRLLVASALRAEAAPHPLVPYAIGARTFSVGEVLNRRFRILRFIAKGGMGEVYEASDVQLGETVALKTIVCTGLDNARLFPRLRAEVQIARRVTHPNVCRILEFGTTEARAPYFEVVPYFTMEYLRGSTLKDSLNRRGRLPAAEVVTLATQILDGLAAVHAAGIVHRDLKTENVFLIPNTNGIPRAVVMDFGLARSIATQDPGSGLSGDALVGTPAYMAPEQTLGGEPTPAWDIFSLGVVVFELLSGKLPFSGKTALATAMARIRDSAPPLSSAVPGIHPELQAVVARCLQTDPARRFPSAIAARDAFVRIQHTQRLSTEDRGRRALHIGSGLGLAALAAVLSLYCHRFITSDRNPPGGVIVRDPLLYAAANRKSSKEVHRSTAESRSNATTPAPLAVSQASAANSLAANSLASNSPARDVDGTSRKTKQRSRQISRLAGGASMPLADGRKTETAPAVSPSARTELANDLAIPEFARRQRPTRIGEP